MFCKEKETSVCPRIPRSTHKTNHINVPNIWKQRKKTGRDREGSEENRKGNNQVHHSGIFYSSSCTSVIVAGSGQAAGDLTTNLYSHLAGSVASTSSVSSPHSTITLVDRSGPFQQPCPLSYFCSLYLSFSPPDHSRQYLYCKK